MEQLLLKLIKNLCFFGKDNVWDSMIQKEVVKYSDGLTIYNLILSKNPKDFIQHVKEISKEDELSYVRKYLTLNNLTVHPVFGEYNDRRFKYVFNRKCSHCCERSCNVTICGSHRWMFCDMCIENLANIATRILCEIGFVVLKNSFHKLYLFSCGLYILPELENIIGSMMIELESYATD